MKNLASFVPQLFADYSDNISHITEKQTKLASVSAQSSTFQNAVNVAKLVSAQTNSSKFAVNIFDSVFTLSDYDFKFRKREGLRARFQHSCHDEPDETTLAYDTMLNLLISKLGDSTLQEVGYYQGVPVYCMAQKVSVPEGVMYQYNGFIDFYFGKKEVEGQTVLPEPFLQFKSYPTTLGPLIDIRVFSNSLDDEDPWTFTGDAIVEGEEIDEWFVGNCDTILNSMFNDYISNDCIESIIKRAQTDGVISRDQIESILDQYQATNISTSIRSLIAGTGRLDSISLITLIGKIYKNMGASYDDQNQTDTFTVYDVPTFITSIVQTVVSLLITVVAIVLSIVWRAIGVIVGLIMTIVQYVIELVQKNAVKTNANITASSLTPIINNPLLTFQMTSSQLQEYLNRYFTDVSLADVDEVLQEYGCAMISPKFTGSAPYYLWILPRDYNNILSKYTLQFLVSTNESGISPGIATITAATNNLEVWRNLGDRYARCTGLGFLCSNTGAEAPYRMGERDSEYRYLHFSDDKMREVVTINMMKCLNDMFNFASIDSVIGFEPTADHYLYITELCKYTALTDRYDLDPDKFTISNILAVMNNGLNNNVFSNNILKVRFFSCCYSIYTKRMISGLNVAPTWDELTAAFDLIRSAEEEISDWVTLRLGVGANAKFQYDNLNDGHTLADPAVEWPNLSKKALINALIVTGVTVAAVAGIAVSLKLGLKKVAFNKLASRQAKFDAAQDKYNEMQTNIANDKKNMGGYTAEEINSITKDYYKANKKLTRAWSFAGKFGLSMFNGFSTSSSSSAFSDSPTSNPLSSLTSTTYQNNVGTNPVDSLNVNDVSSYNQIIHVITGA